MDHFHLTRRDFLLASSVFAGTGLSRPRPAAPLRFGLVTDIHYADIAPAGIKMYRDGTAKLADCVKFMNAQKVDFLAELGDFKDQSQPPDEKTTIGYLRTIEREFRRFKGPCFHVLGNHDVDCLSKQQFLEAVGAPSAPVPGSHGNYYAFTMKGVTFLVLDADFRSNGESYDHGNFKWEDANIPHAEMEWIEKELGASSSPAIVFIHHRLDGEGGYFVKNAAAVRGVLQQSKKVAAVFQGHQHEGGYSLIDGIHYYTLKAVVEGSGVENSSYAVVEADASFNLTVTGYKRAESRQLGRTQ